MKTDVKNDYTYGQNDKRVVGTCISTANIPQKRGYSHQSSKTVHALLHSTSHVTLPLVLARFEHVTYVIITFVKIDFSDM